MTKSNGSLGEDIVMKPIFSERPDVFTSLDDYVVQKAMQGGSIAPEMRAERLRQKLAAPAVNH